MKSPVRILAAGILALVMAGPPAFSAESYVREIEIKSEPEALGQKVFMVRFTPAKTVVYDEIVFECVYRQELPWEDIRGRKYTKILEPVNFIFRRSRVSFVNDLDTDANFKVPVSFAMLSEKFGATTFNKAYPISVNRIRIAAVVDGQALWSLELAASGKFDVTEETLVPAAPDAVPVS